jgi:hypothetical protein
MMLIANIRLVWKGLQGTNTLNFFGLIACNKEKRFSIDNRCQCYEKFFVPHGKANKLAFVLSKLFQPSLVCLSKVSSLSFSEAPVSLALTLIAKIS